jgi:hypothetical protein
MRIIGRCRFARVAELADAYGSGPYGATRGGSSPLASNLSFYPLASGQPASSAKRAGQEGTAALQFKNGRVT